MQLNVIIYLALGGMIMKKILSDDIVIRKLHFANLVGSRTQYLHEDRANHGFAMILGGATEYVFEGGRKLVCGDGEIIYLPHHSYYSNNSRKDGKCYCINFSITEDLYLEPFVFTPKNLPVFENIFKTADKYWMARQDGFELKCRSIAYDLIYNIRREMQIGYTDSGKFKLIAPAVDYIHANYTTEHINVEDLAKKCGISHEYLRRLFRLRYNATPVAYINSMKIARAKELIGSGLYSVAEAAAASGYADMSHFSREFKKATGVSPSSFGR